MINETLYKSGGHEALKMMREDPKVYEEVNISAFVFVTSLSLPSLVSCWFSSSGPIMAEKSCTALYLGSF